MGPLGQSAVRIGGIGVVGGVAAGVAGNTIDHDIAGPLTTGAIGGVAGSAMVSSLPEQALEKGRVALKVAAPGFAAYCAVYLGINALD